jgi:hypothetical protein
MFLNLVFVALLALLAWNATGYELVSGVVTHTIAPRERDWHSERPALVLACSGQNLIKVWPLPVESPWWEDLRCPHLVPGSVTIAEVEERRNGGCTRSV